MVQLTEPYLQEDSQRKSPSEEGGTVSLRKGYRTVPWWCHDGGSQIHHTGLYQRKKVWEKKKKLKGGQGPRPHVGKKKIR